MQIKPCGYTRISVDLNEDRDENTSIETQKKRIKSYIKREFPDAVFNPATDIFEDRDRSGYTFEQREGYQKMKAAILRGDYNVIIIKDLTRFCRRVSLGAIELEHLLSLGVRIIGCDDGVDMDKSIDTLTFIRLIFAEDTVTSTSRKVSNAIETRQREGTWICNAPYGYYIRPDKKGHIFIDEEGKAVVQKIFELYVHGYGYKSIAHYLTENKCPTGRALMLKHLEERGGDTSKMLARSPINHVWSAVSVQKIVTNDFYIGTLRQGVWKRKGINKTDVRTNTSDHKVFLNHHEAIIDMEIWNKACARFKKSSKMFYSDETLNKNPYTGTLVCGDCNSPMFAVGGKRYRRGYNCGRYLRHGISKTPDETSTRRKVNYTALGCTGSHFIAEETLNNYVKNYIIVVKDKLAKSLAELDVEKSKASAKQDEARLLDLQSEMDDLKAEIRINERQRSRQIAKDESKEAEINQLFDEMNDQIRSEINAIERKIIYYSDQVELKKELRSTFESVIEKFNALIEKQSYTKSDINGIIEKIVVDSDKTVTIYLHSDITDLFNIQ